MLRPGPGGHPRRRARRLRRSGDRLGRRRGRARDPTRRDARHPAGRARRRHADRRGTAAAAPAAARGTAPVKAEGWGTLKGQVVFGGDPPAPKVLAREGQGREGPRGLRQGRPDHRPSGWSSTARPRGSRTSSSTSPSPPRVNDEAKKAAALGQGRLRPEEVRLRAARPGLDDRRDDHAQVERPGQPQHQRQAQADPVQLNLLAAARRRPVHPDSAPSGPRPR